MAATRTPRSALIGAGMVGSVHAHAVHRAGGQLVAICASTPQRSQSAAEQLNAERAAPSAVAPLQKHVPLTGPTA